MNGDGFPAWHQDKVKNLMIAVTIVVNVGTIEKNSPPDDEEDSVWAEVAHIDRDVMRRTLLSQMQ